MAAEMLTQSRLQDYIDCPYRYFLRYVERVESPSIQAEPVQEFEQAVDRGTTFHRLVHQYLLGVPAETVERHIGDERVRQWWSQFLSEGLHDLPAQRLPEVTLVARLADTVLAAKLDLLAFEPGRVVIVDWKTLRKPHVSQLETRLQTKVYRWVVSQAASEILGSALAPEDIEMRYWFAGDPSPSVDISYSHDEMVGDERELSALIRKIEQEKDFPRTDKENLCRVCAYRSISRPEQLPVTVSSVEDGDVHWIGESVETDL